MKLLLILMLVLSSCGGVDIKFVEADNVKFAPHTYNFDTKEKRDAFIERLKKNAEMPMEEIDEPIEIKDKQKD